LWLDLEIKYEKKAEEEVPVAESSETQQMLYLERGTGIKPATSSLARKRSIAELPPRYMQYNKNYLRPQASHAILTMYYANT
jgi:hypothetical protein